MESPTVFENWLVSYFYVAGMYVSWVKGMPGERKDNGMVNGERRRLQVERPYLDLGDWC